MSCRKLVPHKLRDSPEVQGLVAANGAEGGVTGNGVSLLLGQGRWGAPALFSQDWGAHSLLR